MATVPAFMALKFADGGWVATGAGLAAGAFAPPAGGPPATAFQATRRVQFAVTRDFDGINSSGGPQTVVRPDFTDVSVERPTDLVSPLLMECCLTGKQLSEVYLLQGDPATTDYVRIQLAGVQVTRFEDVGRHANGRTFTDTLWYDTVVDTLSLDRITLLYTQIAFDYGSTARGWDTGANAAWSAT